ncbi:MAG: hypothetical protein Q9227_008294 [Pyrenula ochraceoflavens]
MAASSAPKRSLFKRPEWASSAPVKVNDDDTAFYRHTTAVADIVAEKAALREAARKQRILEEDMRENEERKRREGREAKRRKLDQEGAEGRKSTVKHGEEKQQSSRVSAPEHDEARNSPYVASRSKPDLIDLGCDEEAFNTDSHLEPDIDLAIVDARKIPSRKKKSEYSDDSSDNDSDYTRKIKQRAREKERRQKQGLEPIATKAASPIESARSPSFRNSTDSPSTSFHRDPIPRTDSAASKTFSPTPIAAEDEPIVEILIRSHIPNTKPLVVRRRESQPLKEVRLAWCAKQLFNAEFTRKVYFTWRGTRVYDVTTCRNFVIQAQKEQKERHEDFFGENWSDEPTGKEKKQETLKIELEAVTPEILEEIRKQRREEEERKNAQAEDAGGEELLPPDPPKEKKIGIILKGKGTKEVRLKVTQAHLIGKIVQAYRQQAQVPVEKGVFLLFDGERLEEGDSVGEAGLEDGDCVDVQIR